jgi:hypothetical protein
LRRDFPDRWVAMHHGHVVDSDTELPVLHRRILASFGREPVLIERVSDAPITEITWLSPRLRASTE